MKYALVLCVALLSSCAAQSYARLKPVLSTQAEAMSCAEIALELVRAEGFREEVRAGAKTAWWEAPVRLTSIGARNAQERNEAARSAEQRLVMLRLAQTRCNGV